MAVRRRKTTRRRVSRKSGGHPFLVLLFFVCLIVGSAYVTDRMTNAPDAEPAQQVTAIHHLFNDKEMQGLVPADDPGTPESVKEKVKAALNKVVTVEDRAGTLQDAKAEDKVESTTESTPSAPLETKKDNSAPEKKGLLSSIISIRSDSGESKESAPEKPAVAAQSSSGRESTVQKSPAPAAAPAKASAPAAAVPAKAKVSAPVASAPAPKPAAKPAPAKPAPVSKPEGKVTGRLAVVIDDAGRDLETQHIYEQMGIPLTLAIMPNQSHTTEAAQSWHAAGLPFILHQPMESVSGIGMEPKVILTSMSDAEIRTMLKASLSQVPGAIGINNHQGSKATTDRHTMDVVMEELHHRGLFFFDSRTNSTTEADVAAKEYGVPYVRNDLFVDNSTDVATIESMIQEGADRAKKEGTYVIIGHCRPHTAQAFQAMVPKLKQQGIEFIYVSSLAK